MKSFLRLFLVPLISLTFAGVSFAQGAPPAGSEKKMEKKSEAPKTSRVTGEATAVDAKAGTLTVKAKDKEMSFTAEGKSAKGALEKIKVGDQVRVSYTDKDGKLIARSVSAAKTTKAGETKAKSAMKKEETKGGMK
ncbi:MAG: hypothetical protein HY695_30105 [Deltaproteobacteria bacterium]|nr:hypothetical protein [Deltaproteobacteria bacterium]